MTSSFVVYHRAKSVSLSCCSNLQASTNFLRVFRSLLKARSLEFSGCSLALFFSLPQLAASFHYSGKQPCRANVNKNISEGRWIGCEVWHCCWEFVFESWWKFSRSFSLDSLLLLFCVFKLFPPCRTQSHLKFHSTHTLDFVSMDEISTTWTLSPRRTTNCLTPRVMLTNRKICCTLSFNSRGCCCCRACLLGG